MFSYKNNRFLSLKAILITLTFISALTVIRCTVSGNCLLPICNMTKFQSRVSLPLFQLLTIWNLWVKVKEDFTCAFLLVVSLENWRQKEKSLLNLYPTPLEKINKINQRPNQTKILNGFLFVYSHSQRLPVPPAL